MRTTVTLDPDVGHLIRERMQAKGVSFKRALNDAVREGAARQPTRPRYVMAPVSLGAARVDVTKALQLAGELKGADVVRRTTGGR